MTIGVQNERQSWSHFAPPFDRVAQDAGDGLGAGCSTRMQSGGDEASALTFIPVEGHKGGVSQMRAEHADFLLARDDAGGEIEHKPCGRLAPHRWR